MNAMDKQPDLNEIQAVERTATLLVAMSVFGRLAAANAIHEDDANKTTRVQSWIDKTPRAAFDAAEAFMSEARQRGYDWASIIKLAEGLLEL